MYNVALIKFKNISSECGHLIPIEGNIDIPYEFTDNRAGDVSTYYSSVSKAKKELDWEAKYTLEDMCIDSWKSKK